MIGVVIDNQGATVRLQRILDTARNPRAIMAVAGREAGNQLKKHFRAKDRTGANSLSDRRTHFWNQVAGSVSAPVVEASGRTVTVSVTDGRFAQKVFGGTITAKRSRLLTIPVAEPAYGRRASVLEQVTGLKLFLLRTNAHLFLAAAAQQQVQVYYLLTPSVQQDADPTALPPEPQFTDAVVARAQSALDRQLQPPSA